MNVYSKIFDCGDRMHIDVDLEPGGILRVDQTDAGPLYEGLYGDFDHEQIIRIQDGAKLLPYLIREGLAGRALTFDRIAELADEAQLTSTCWAG